MGGAGLPCCAQQLGSCQCWIRTDVCHNSRTVLVVGAFSDARNCADVDVTAGGADRNCSAKELEVRVDRSECRDGKCSQGQSPIPPRQCCLNSLHRDEQGNGPRSPPAREPLSNRGDGAPVGRGVLATDVYVNGGTVKHGPGHRGPGGGGNPFAAPGIKDIVPPVGHAESGDQGFPSAQEPGARRGEAAPSHNRTPGDARYRG